MTESSRKDRTMVPENTAQTGGLTSDSRPLVIPSPSGLQAAPNVTGNSQAAAVAVRAAGEEHVALFPSTEANELRARWDSIQVGFVDEPRKAVAEADALVSATMNRLSDVFARERQNLEEQWGRSENPSTEDFRVALRRYRSFFSRLLAI